MQRKAFALPFIIGLREAFLPLFSQLVSGLVYTGTDRFTISSITGYAVQLLRNAEGEITVIDLIQPNPTFKAQKKK